MSIRRPGIAGLTLALLAGVAGLRAWAEPKNDFRFSILGDRTGSTQAGIYGRVWREVDLLHPDFVMNVGDTIQGGSDAAAVKEWRELRPFFAQYNQYPLYFTPGNHDVFSAASQLLYEKETGRPVQYGFNYQDAHFTVLDNSRSLELSAEQLEFLERDLVKNKDRSPKFVFFHQPFWIPLIKLGASNFPLHQLALKYGVTHIFSGHGHQFLRMTREGISYIEVGSSGAHMTAAMELGHGFKEGRFYHHVWARVKGAKVELTVKEIDGAGGAGRMFDAAQWDESGPGFDPADPGKPFSKLP